MAAGTPVVATETEGARELIQSGETGLLVSIGDVDKLAEAVLQLLHDREWRVRLGTEAQKDASERFSVERMIDETEQIYRVEIQEQSDKH